MITVGMAVKPIMALVPGQGMVRVKNIKGSLLTLLSGDGGMLGIPRPQFGDIPFGMSMNRKLPIITLHRLIDS